MKKLSHLALGLCIIGSLAAPPFALAAGSLQIGDYCGSSPTDCAAGLSCDPDQQVCYPNQAGGTGSPKSLNDACSSNSDCASNYCAYNSEFRMSVCTASLKSLGQACSAAADCASDYCAYDSEIRARVCSSPTSQTGGGCVAGDQCVTGNQVYGYCDASGVCQPDSTAPGGGGSGGGSGGPAGGGVVGSPGAGGGNPGGGTGAGGGITGPTGTGLNLGYLQQYKASIVSIVNDILVPVLIAIAFIVFLWGVYKYFIQGAADEKSRADGRQFVLWGIIGFVVITSLWGFVNVVGGTVLPSGVSKTAPPTPRI